MGIAEYLMTPDAVIDMALAWTAKEPRRIKIGDRQIWWREQSRGLIDDRVFIGCFAGGKVFCAVKNDEGQLERCEVVVQRQDDGHRVERVGGLARK